MEFVDHSATVWGLCPVDFNETLRWIERAARTCYNSRNRITKTSAMPFVERLLKKGHYGILEHSCRAGTLNYEIDDNSRFLRATSKTAYYIGSWLAWFHRWQTKPTIYVPWYNVDLRNDRLWRVTVEFETDRAISHQLVRHRPASFLQMSQRYVDHSNPRVVRGPWATTTFGVTAVKTAFDAYKELREIGKHNEQARAVLPNCTATRIVMTTTIEHLKYIVDLRSTKACDLGMRALMASLITELKKEDWWNEHYGRKSKQSMANFHQRRYHDAETICRSLQRRLRNTDRPCQ